MYMNNEIFYFLKIPISLDFIFMLHVFTMIEMSNMTLFIDLIFKKAMFTLTIALFCIS